MQELFDELRKATNASHRRLDSHPALARLMSQELTFEHYRKSLTVMWPAHVDLESRVIAYWQGRGSDYLPLPRAHILEVELKQLGVDCGELLLSNDECERLVLKLDTVSKAVGATYVLEGSRLGGAFLARKLEKSLPIHEHGFFKSDAAKHWTLFRNTCFKLGDSLNIDEAVWAASQSFERYYSIICSRSVVEE